MKPQNQLQSGATRRGGLGAGATARGGGLAATSTRRTGGRFGTSKRLTHGTTTMSQDEVDQDHTIIDGKRIKIKPKSLYPERDAAEQAKNDPKPRRDGATESRRKLKFEFQTPVHSSTANQRTLFMPVMTVTVIFMTHCGF